MSDGGEGGQEAAQWALRFISGKYQGGEFPLRPNREIIIGRSSDLDMVLVEDMVSRKHAKITTDETVVTIQDLGSTNGTFVNGEKVRKADLKDGDRILIGTSIIKLVFVDGDMTSSVSENEARSKMAVAANKRSAAPPKSMSGSIEEIPLPDLLQLLSTSRKSGVLVVRSDRRTGALLPQGADLLRQHRGPADDRPAQGDRPHARAGRRARSSWSRPTRRRSLEEMDESTEALLMEGMRQLDEFRMHLEKLPPLNAPVAVPRPLKREAARPERPRSWTCSRRRWRRGPLRRCSTRSDATDLAIAENLVSLIEKGYLLRRLG